MICPFCLHKKTEIYNSRTAHHGTKVWRRRQCLTCKGVFTTEESFDPTSVWKVEKANKLAPYSRSRLVLSIIRACDHRKNIEARVFYLAQIVEERLLPLASQKKLTLTALDIFTVTAEVVKTFDATAYLKYLSYHSPQMDARALRKRLRASS